MERRRSRNVPTIPLVALIDADADTRELCTDALAPLGFDTVVVRPGQDAYTQLWEKHPDVIVMEMTLSHADAWRLVHQLRRTPHTRDIPIVVLTASAESTIRERAEREHCAGLFLKSCRPEELARGLRDALRPAPRR
jgi:CheY-like chemotaxis protein